MVKNSHEEHPKMLTQMLVLQIKQVIPLTGLLLLFCFFLCSNPNMFMNIEPNIEPNSYVCSGPSLGSGIASSSSVRVRK